MTLFELVTALNGELVCNQARVRRGGKWVVLGRIINNAWEITEAGHRLLNAANVEPATSPTTEPEPPKPVRRTRVARSQ